MNIILNGANPSALYRGTNPVKAVYRGDDLIWKKSRLPTGYQEVEWIESDGNAFIQLRCTFDSTDEVYCKGALLDIRTDKFLVAPRTWNSSGSNRFALFGAIWSNVDSGFRFTNGYGSRATDITMLVPLTVADSDFHEMHYYNGVFESADLGISFDTHIEDLSYSGETTEIRLFYGYNGPTKGILQEYWHKRGEIYTADVIPCYRLSDGAIGMYDTSGSICPLTNTPFYINAGTGAFTKGADV